MPQLPSSAHIVLIGGGKMGEAILGGWIASEKQPAAGLTADSFSIVDPGDERRAYLLSTYGVACFESAEEVRAADIVVLAVKPQVMMDVLKGLSPLPQFSESLFITIAAGLATPRFVEALPQGSRVVRAMPNTPLLVGKGATAVCGSKTANPEDVTTVQALFACLGKAVVVEEDAMDVVSAISGSGPAYVAAMIEALTQAGAEAGLEAGLAESLAVQTVYGTAALLLETGQSPAEVRKAVCSPGGTTLAALSAMDGAGLNEVYNKGVLAAIQRAKELGA